MGRLLYPGSLIPKELAVWDLATIKCPGTLRMAGLSLLSSFIRLLSEAKTLRNSKAGDERDLFRYVYLEIASQFTRPLPKYPSD